MKSYLQSFHALLNHRPQQREAVFPPTEKYKILLSARNELLQGDDYNDHYKNFGKDVAQVLEIVYQTLKKKTKESGEKDAKEEYSDALKALAKANGLEPDNFLEEISGLQKDFSEHRFDGKDVKKTKSLLKEVFKVASEFEKQDIENFNKALQKFHLLRQSDHGKYVGKVLAFNSSIEDLDAAADMLKKYPDIVKNERLLKKVTKLAETISDYGVAVATLNAYCVSNTVTAEGVERRVRELLPRARHYFQEALAKVANDTDMQSLHEALNILLDIAVKEKKMYERQLSVDLRTAFSPQGSLDMNLLANHMPGSVSGGAVVTPGVQQSQSPSPSAPTMLGGSDFRAQTSPAIRSELAAEPTSGPSIESIKAYGDPRGFAQPRDPYEQNLTRPAAFDDKYLREVQRITDWADYADNTSRKIQKVEEIGNIMEGIASTPSGKPDPEYISLVKRGKRLQLLQRMMQEVPKINKLTNEVEKTALDAHHGYLQGLNTVMSGKLKNRIEEANIAAKMNKMSVTGAKNLAGIMFETELELKQFFEKMFNAHMQIQKLRDDNTWSRVKAVAGSFRY